MSRSIQVPRSEPFDATALETADRLGMQQLSAELGSSPRPDGTTPATGATVVTIAEKLEIVASGAAITFLPESAASAYHRHDVAWVPIDDIEPSVVAVAWPTRRKPRLVGDFVAYVTLLSDTITSPDG